MENGTMAQNQEAVEKALLTALGCSQDSASRPPNHASSAMTLSETQEAQSSEDTFKFSNNRPNRRARRAERVRQREIQAAENVKMSKKLAQKHTRKAEKHAQKAKEFARKASKEKDTTEIKRFAREVRKRAKLTFKHVAKANKYDATIRDGGPQSEQGTSQGYTVAGNVAEKKRGREEDSEDQQQPPKKRTRMISLLEEGEVIEDEPTQHTKRKCIRQDQEVDEKEPSIKGGRRGQRGTRKRAASKAPTPVSKDPVKKFPHIPRQCFDYIRGSLSAKLRSIELELKRRLNDQEQGGYAMHFDTTRPEHCKEVTSTLLQKVQSELKKRTDAAPPKPNGTQPRFYSSLRDEIPYALATLYKKFCRKFNTFTYFGKLPPELRFMIWKQTQDPRIVKIEMVRSGSGSFGSIVSRTEPAAIFLACKESRAIGFSIYEPLPMPFNLRLNVPVPILVNYDCDTIFHDRSLFQEPELFKNPNVEKANGPIIKVDRLICDLSTVRSLAFDGYFPQQKVAPSLGADINSCKSLEKLTLLLGETYRAHLIPKGEHCPIIKGFSLLNRLSRPPLLYCIKCLKDRNYLTWDVDAGELGGKNSIRGQFRDIVNKEKKREAGAIKLLEAFHKEFHRFRKQWEEGPKKKRYPQVCKCHTQEHEKIIAAGLSTYEPPRSTKPLGDITPEVIVDAIPCGGITRAGLVDKLDIRSYSVDAQLEFHAMSKTVLFKMEDQKLRLKKNAPLDVTSEQFVAAIPPGGILKEHLYQPDHIPPEEAAQRSKWEKRRFRPLPVFPQFSTYSEEAQKAFLDMVDSMLFLAADGKMKLKENAPFDIHLEDILNVIPQEGITRKELNMHFNMKTYSPDAREQFKALLLETLAMKIAEGKLYPKKAVLEKIASAPAKQPTPVRPGFLWIPQLPQVAAAPAPQATTAPPLQAADPNANPLDNTVDDNVDIDVEMDDAYHDADDEVDSLVRESNDANHGVSLSGEAADVDDGMDGFVEESVDVVEGGDGDGDSLFGE